LSALELVQIGRCHKPHGVKGGFVFHLENEENSILKKGMKVLLLPEDKSSELPMSGKNFVIENITFGHKVMVYLVGISNRNQVEAMTPFNIRVNRNLFPKASEDELYLVDLIGCKVINQKTKQEIGYVKKYYEHGAQTNIVVETKEGEFDLPLIENFVVDIDIDKNEIYINQPEYLE